MSGTAASAMRALLGLARDSLADARLLAERRRRNEIVLTRLALHQALQAISISEGLDASDELRLDTLLKRVPRDHPQAELVAGLRTEEAQTIAAVAELVEALGHPAPKPVLQPMSQSGAGSTSKGRPVAEPEADTTVGSDAPGPTALTASPQGHGRAGSAGSLSSTAFWTLMDRWRIGDLDALALIGHEGGLTKKGTRPRFRLEGEEAGRYASLRALDVALETLGLDPKDWLATPRPEAPFDGEMPLALLLRQGTEGAKRLVHALNRQGLKTALGRLEPP